jgi:hypothetical protein
MRTPLIAYLEFSRAAAKSVRVTSESITPASVAKSDLAAALAAEPSAIAF